MTPELLQEIRDVLARLSTLSEASASNLQPRTSGGKNPSKPPAGVALGRDLRATADPDRPPPKERSLYDWFRWQFEHTDPEDIERLERLVQLADIEHKARAIHTPRRLALRAGKLDVEPGRTTEPQSSWPAPAPLSRRAYGDESERPNEGTETEEAAAARIVEWYEGLPAIQVAYLENTTERWVLKARKAHGRDPDDGRRRAPFLDWDDEERRRQIDLLRSRAKDRDELIGAKRIAQHFGVAVSTVQRYLDPERAAA